MGSERRWQHIGVVVGMATEARIARGLGWRIAIGGGTTAGAYRAARRLIEEGCDALVSFGLAGGLDPELRPGKLIVPSTVLVDGTEDRGTDPTINRILGGATGHTLIGVQAIVATVAAKRGLHERSGAAAADLESGAVACVAAAHRIPFAALRAICDPAGRTLPPAALVALDARGTIGVGRVLGSLLAQPAQLPALLALAVDAASARRSLTSRVRQVCERHHTRAA
jgi:adenosylhomocysteine nucleosidase